MGYRYKEFTYASSDGKSHVAAYLYTPETDGPIRAIVQLSHGMCDYVGRYTGLARALTDAGYAFCGNDHLGHGSTARHSDELGFFSSEDGADTLVTDVHKLTLSMRAQYHGTPVVLVGHSMGSFIARLCAVNYARDIDGAVFLGTGNNAIAGLGRFLARRVAQAKGENWRSPFLTRLTFGGYNRKVARDPYGFDWLSRDEDVITAYAVDPFCNFTFTASAYADLFTMVSRVSAASWVKAYPKSMPTCIMSGACDPVGHMGRDPKAIAERLSGAGVRDVTLKIYEGARHELHNDICREEFFRDLIAWLNAHY